MNKYIVCSRKDEGDFIIATIENDKVTGPEADRIEKLLRSRGWPTENPMRILHGSYLWAAEAPENEQAPVK